MRNDYFRDQTGEPPQELDLWEPIVIPKEEIDAEIERLASLPAPANGRRRSLIVHPRNTQSKGLAPGIEVALDVLKPGERTVPYRQNSTQVNFVIRGRRHFLGRRKDVRRRAVRRLEHAVDAALLASEHRRRDCSCG